MRLRTTLAGPVVLLLAACGEDGAGAIPSATGAATTTAAITPTSAVTPAVASQAAQPATTADEPPPETGSIAQLKQRAMGVLSALRRGDSKAAADFCLRKHRDGLEKFIAETIEKKDRARAKAFRAWDGKLGEIRVEGEKARVAFGSSDDQVNYLSFKDKDGEWSLDDIPVVSKAQWDKWGKPAKE
ncbi:MAG: hypothetical protein IPG04_25100 [Polyangiaceae bacterium]|nr:hypothetical protein [Polyangiaceae bacterium]